MKNLKLLIVLVILSACNQGKQRTEASTEIDTNANAKVADTVDNKNAIVINERMVLFLMPDSTEINEMQSKYVEEDFIEIISDMTWYPDMAGEQLDSLNIKNQYFDKDSIIIKHSDNSETVLKRKELDGDMVLIHPDKKPVITNSVDFDKAQTLSYFNSNN
ncbi:hypothetical protein [Patiriisocius hiemis]|uniref:Lipoprotein n=1 Tax=Patiriisocius hiemis TaxID=3075604 RepID=A0ABU2YA35_9FLAO|nr:hypothetical protein [Constantimarinum sp. W242]MDT0555048.1 hypothetical protein [Constantimarinum sp. W242]